MFKILFIFLIFSQSAWSNARLGAIGLESGVARLSDGDHSVIGMNHLVHFEYQIDPIVGFFGQAGKTEASKSKYDFKQTAFTGGVLIDLFPFLELRLGLSNNVQEIDDGDSVKKTNQLGPVTGLTYFIPMGIWKIGTSASISKTQELQNIGMRLMLLMTF